MTYLNIKLGFIIALTITGICIGNIAYQSINNIIASQEKKFDAMYNINK